MKITDINIVNNNIVVSVDNTKNISTIYIDSIYNYDKIFSVNNDDHTYAITQFDIVDNTIQIDLQSNEDIDTSAFIVTINGISKFYFDKKELYYKSIDLLTEYCSTCLDKEQKEKLLLFMLKDKLLQYAISNDILEDQVNIYRDIARLLKIDVISNKQNIIKKYNHSKCKTCCNGVCSLC